MTGRIRVATRQHVKSRTHLKHFGIGHVLSLLKCLLLLLSIVSQQGYFYKEMHHSTMKYLTMFKPGQESFVRIAMRSSVSSCSGAFPSFGCNTVRRIP